MTSPTAEISKKPALLIIRAGGLKNLQRIPKEALYGRLKAKNLAIKTLPKASEQWSPFFRNSQE
jgi:hypothetical protein